MARRHKKWKGEPQELGVIWEIPDKLWERIEPILLEYWPRKPTGRLTADWRNAINGIIFRMRSGCRWNKLPRQLGDDRTVHRWFQRWYTEKICAVLVEDCEELGGVSWEWQAADGAMAKARFGEKKGRNPADRGKHGTKRSAMVEEDGGPLGLVIHGAHVHGTKLLDATIKAIVVDRPEPTPEERKHLCLDKGCHNPTGHETVAKHHYTPHIRAIGEEKRIPQGNKKHKPRRRVVERTLGWLFQCRAILVRYDKNWFHYLELIQLACALLRYRRLHRVSTA